MNLVTSTPQQQVIARVKFLPAVSILMPFRPVATIKKNLEYQVKSVMSKVEATLTTHYTAEKAIPVIVKLKNLLSTLNYNTHKKSIAIFVSPVVEKVYYFGMEVEEKIITDPAFKLSYLASCKKDLKECLILHVNENFSKLYLASNNELRLIKFNTPADSPEISSCGTSLQYEAASSVKRKRLSLNRFLFRMDQGLSIMLEAYPLPIIVMGPANVLGCFKTITKNHSSIVEYISGNFEKAFGQQLRTVVENILPAWNKLKQQHLLNKIRHAKRANKLKTGLEETFQASLQNKGVLLIVEKQMLTRPPLIRIDKPFFKIDPGNYEVFFMKDEVDHIVKMVLEAGGDVELVDDGVLRDYRGIALIDD